MDTFQGFKDFSAVRLHFKADSYDYFKYHGKTKVNWATFEKFKGRRILHNLIKKHPHDFIEFIATGFVYDNDISWIGDFAGETAERNWTTHQKYMQSITRSFTNEVEALFEDRTAKEVFISIEDDLPAIERSRINNLTSIETCCILDRIFNYIDRSTCTHPLWENTERIVKYNPFLGINLPKMSSIVKDVMT